jgi:hypothetical protein
MLMRFMTSEGPWGFTPGWRKLLPSEMPEWEMVKPGDRVFEALDRKEGERCEIRQAIELARELPLGGLERVDSLPSMNDLSAPSILGMIESARTLGADEFRLIDPDGEEMLFRL